MKKKHTLEVEVDIVPDKGTRRVWRMDVDGMLKAIRASMPDAGQRDLLDEYAKLYVLKQIGVKEYPLKK